MNTLKVSFLDKDTWLTRVVVTDVALMSLTSDQRKQVSMKQTAELPVKECICTECREVLLDDVKVEVPALFKWHAKFALWSCVMTQSCQRDECRKKVIPKLLARQKQEEAELYGIDLPSSSERRSVCAHCEKLQEVGAAKFKVCGQCRLARYCSTECQEKAWSTHKHFCFEKAK